MTKGLKNISVAHILLLIGILVMVTTFLNWCTPMFNSSVHVSGWYLMEHGNFFWVAVRPGITGFWSLLWGFGIALGAFILVRGREIGGKIAVFCSLGSAITSLIGVIIMKVDYSNPGIGLWLFLIFSIVALGVSIGRNKLQEAI